MLPSLRTALKWVAFRINLKLPSIETAEIKALEQEVFTQRGKPLKEAIAFPIELVQAMERFVANPAHPVPARVFRWVLCMIFASSALTMRSTSSPTRSRSSPTVSSAFLGKPRGRGSAEEPSSWSRKSPSPMCLGLKQVLTCSICSPVWWSATFGFQSSTPEIDGELPLRIMPMSGLCSGSTAWSSMQVRKRGSQRKSSLDHSRPSFTQEGTLLSRTP